MKFTFVLMAISLIVITSNDFVFAKESRKTDLLEKQTIQQARRFNLSSHPYWRRLLHYQGDRSEITNAQFFFSAQGHLSAQQELEATIRAFWSSDSQGDQRPQCLFPARFEWLKMSLPQLKESLQTPCEAFEKWANLESLGSISMIFASSYMGNPASIYGHLLMRLNYTSGIFGHPLLSPTLNFGALISPDDGVLSYALKGVFGAYKGRLADERFYNFSNLYGESELRDLWEYELRLTKYEMMRVVSHAWELLLNGEFDYFFFKENCAYRLAELLEMAWDTPSLTQEHQLWLMPLEVFESLATMKTSDQTKPLVSNIRLIPSRERKLLQRLSQASPTARLLFSTLAESPDSWNDPLFQKATDEEQAESLDLLLDYHQYRKANDSPLLSKQQRIQLLQMRSQLPAEKPLAPFRLRPPTQGSPPHRLRLAQFQNNSKESFTELGIWTSYHDVLGLDIGRVFDADLVTLDLRLRTADDEVKLHQLDLIRVRALNGASLALPFFAKWAWGFRLGLETDQTLNHVKKFEGGFGKTLTFETAQRMEVYFMAGAFLWQHQSFQDQLIAGAFPQIGLLANPLQNWKFELGSTWHHSWIGDSIRRQKVFFNNSWSLTRLWEMRLEWKNESMAGKLTDGEIGLALHHYF